MKLAAIYNVWDGVELLKGSMNCLKDHVDVFIIVYQDISNFGEKYDPLLDMDLSGFNHALVKFVPAVMSGTFNERKKRDLGLSIAKELKCTHFLHLDCDEYYEDFGKAKQQYISSGKMGSACKILTYFKHPTYRFEFPDNYYVPFIHKLKPDTTVCNKNYPFYVDPTRRINETDVELLDVYMHHFSYIRNDIERKARNSSARHNIEKSDLLKDYHSPTLAECPEGYFVKDFNQKLKVVDNIFNLNF